MYAEMLAGGMDFYPAEAAARGFIGAEIKAMCNSDADATWLVREMHRRYDGQKWPGVTVMRALHCSRAEPRDGVHAICASIETEQEQEYRARALPAVDRKMLATGESEPVTAAVSIARTVGDLARKTDLDNVGKKINVRDFPVRRLAPGEKLTQEEVDRAVDEFREKRAKAEIA